jgi:hypothetical protein
MKINSYMRTRKKNIASIRIRSHFDNYVLVIFFLRFKYALYILIINLIYYFILYARVQ